MLQLFTQLSQSKRQSNQKDIWTHTLVVYYLCRDKTGGKGLKGGCFLCCTDLSLCFCLLCSRLGHACALHQIHHMSTSCWWFHDFQTTDRVQWTCPINFGQRIQQNCNYLQRPWHWNLAFPLFKKPIWALLIAPCVVDTVDSDLLWWWHWNGDLSNTMTVDGEMLFWCNTWNL